MQPPSDLENKSVAPGWLSQAIGRSRYIVVLAVAAVLLVAISLFILGTILAGTSIWQAWQTVLTGHSKNAHLTLVFLEIVSVMLEAVVFFLVGVGLYSLFIAPLNIAVALRVESLNDLEEKIISVVIAILATTFLEHFVEWEKPVETLEFGGALALVVFALVQFQRHSHNSAGEQKLNGPDALVRAQNEMFHNASESQEILHNDE